MRGDMADEEWGAQEALLRVLLYAGASFAIALLAGIWPAVHRFFVFLNLLKFPAFWHDLSNPASFAFLHARSVRIRTRDGEELGAWHMVPPTPRGGDVERDARSTRTVILYLHGNASTRAQRHRRDLYHVLERHFPEAEILAVDYRGFADSTGSPTEHGLIEDAMAAWMWVEEHIYAHGRGKNTRVLIWGHSLGTSIAVGLAELLEKERCAPDEAERSYSEMGLGSLVRGATGMELVGLLLEAPFTDIVEAALNFPGFKLMKWLLPFGLAHSYLHAVMRDKFSSITRVQQLNCCIAIVHGSGDTEIPLALGRKLFEAAQRGRADASFHAIDGAKHCSICYYPELIRTVDELLNKTGQMIMEK